MFSVSFRCIFGKPRGVLFTRAESQKLVAVVLTGTATRAGYYEIHTQKKCTNRDIEPVRVVKSLAGGTAIVPKGKLWL
jgi:hypothetical protein